ncbi:glycosyltransferase family 2 protein [Chryseobacterium sp. TY4]
MSKLLSIIIPTRNRQIYCIESIQSILPDIDNRCEIVIQDNSSDNSLRTAIESLNNENIVYNYNSKPLSFIDNFEEAINLSTGKYFIVLGDDDSTTKDIVPIVEWMERENIESLSSSFVVDYIWPNDNIEKYKTGYLSIPTYKGGVKDIDVDQSVKDLIRNGFLAYQSFNLPRTYHGIVKRSCMDEVKSKGGRYFGGLTPDIYSTVALSCVIKKHKIIDFPFSIAGACPASATVNATVGGHSGKLEDAPHFNNRGEYEWEKLVPSYYSVETIWAETAVKALKEMNYPNWEQFFDKYKLYVYGIYINRKYILKHSINETMKLNEALSINKIEHIWNLYFSLSKYFFKKISGGSKAIDQNSYTMMENVENLKDCKNKLHEAIKNIKIEN